jgi:glycosyltransferase involved in cell wall biosynthesis
MKVLRVIASMDPATGGPCQGIRYSIPYLDSQGCLNEVVCLDDPQAAFLEKDPFPVHALGLGKGPLRYHSGFVRWMEANLSRFDAVIVHGLWLWPSIATWIAIQRLQKKAQHLSASSPSRSANSQLPAPKIPPYFVMPHGMLDPWFQREPERRWKALRNRIYWRLIERRVIRDAAAVLFTCQRELELARTTFPLYTPHREINVGYGVPDPPAHTEAMDRAFYSLCPGLAHNRGFLLFLSRIHPKKGIDLLIRSYAEVVGLISNAADNISSDMHHVPALVIAGPIDSDYAREMIGLSESLLPDRVFISRLPSDHQTPDQSQMHGPSIHFTGMLEGDSKWGAIQLCEAFILPSHQENFGISVAEALSCSKPVLISDKVNIFQEVKEAGAGFTAVDDKEGVMKLITQWITLDMQQRHEMSRNAKLVFKEKFHFGKAGTNLINFLRHEISHKSTL